MEEKMTRTNLIITGLLGLTILLIIGSVFGFFKMFNNLKDEVNLNKENINFLNENQEEILKLQGDTLTVLNNLNNKVENLKNGINTTNTINGIKEEKTPEKEAISYIKSGFLMPLNFENKTYEKEDLEIRDINVFKTTKNNAYYKIISRVKVDYGSENAYYIVEIKLFSGDLGLMNIKWEWDE